MLCMRKTPAEIGKCLLEILTKEKIHEIQLGMLRGGLCDIYGFPSEQEVGGILKEMIYELIVKECFEMYREVFREGLRVSYIHWPMAETECRIDVCPVSFSVGK